MPSLPSQRSRSRLTTAARTGAVIGLATVGIIGLGVVPAQADASTEPYIASINDKPGRNDQIQSFTGSFGERATVKVRSADSRGLVITDLSGRELCRTSTWIDHHDYSCTIEHLPLGTSAIKAETTAEDRTKHSRWAEVHNELVEPTAQAVRNGDVTTVSGTSYASSDIELRNRFGKRIGATRTDADGAFRIDVTGLSIGDDVWVTVTVAGAVGGDTAETLVQVAEGDGTVPPAPTPDPEPSPDPVVAEPNPGEVDPGFTADQNRLRFVGTSAGDQPGQTKITLRGPANDTIELFDEYSGPTKLTAGADGVYTFDTWLEGNRTYEYTALLPGVLRITFTVSAWTGDPAPEPGPDPEPIVDPTPDPKPIVDPIVDPTPDPEPEPVVATPGGSDTDPGFAISRGPVRYVGASAGHASGFTKITLQTTPGQRLRLTYNTWSQWFTADEDGIITFEREIHGTRPYQYRASTPSTIDEDSVEYVFSVVPWDTED